MTNHWALRVALLTFAACFSPKFDDGAIKCGPMEMCPPGMECVGAVCRVNGTPQIDASQSGYQLTVTPAGNGAGVVMSSPTGINCGTDCTETFPAGTMVTLTAAPNADSNFVGWSGGGCTGTGTCVVSLNAPTTVTASFALNNSLVVTLGGNGTGTVTSNPGGINCGSDCSEQYAPNTTVVLTAAPATGSYFNGWSGGGCTGFGTCMVTLDSAKLVTATFTLNQYLLTVTEAGNGSGTVTSTPAGIDCGMTCTENVDYNAMVTLTANPSLGSTFTGWSGGGCTGVDPCTLTITAAQSVTATFTLVQYALTVTKAGNGTGTVTSNPTGISCGVDCTQSYDYNSMVTLSATPTTGSVFTGWSGGGCTGTASCVVTMTAATSVTATFTLTTPTLTVALAGNGSGVVTSTPAGIDCGIDCSEDVDYGSMVTLTATPNIGSVFAGWSGGGCTGTGPCVVTVTGATTVTATFTLTTYLLTVSDTGTGSGTITGTGINCGATCTHTFNYGTMVTLTAAPAAGSTFTGWSGGGCSGTGTCTVTMTAAQSVSAMFTLNTYQLTIATAGNGSGTVTSSPAGINCGIDCAGIFGYGTAVTLTASPSTGSTFSGWSGGGCSGTGTCVVTISQAATVTATFTLNTYLLTVNEAGTGTGTVTSSPAGINCGADCTEPYNYGTVVTLTASASGGSFFAGWSGGGCTGTGTCTVTMAAATTVTATFTLGSNSMTVAKAGNGSGTVTSVPAGINCGVDCNENFTNGTIVTLTASPSTGSTFAGWSGGGCSGTGTCTVTISAAVTITATFTLNQYLLTVQKAGTGNGTVTSSPAGISCGVDCTEMYDYATSVTLTAAPTTGSTFAGWSGGGCSGTGTCTVAMTAAQTVTATFTLNQYTLTVATAGNGSGTVTSNPVGINCGVDCSELYDYSTVVTLTAAPNTGSTFTGWSGGGCSGTGTCSVTMTAATSVTATFTLNTYALTVTKSGPAGSGTVTSSPAGISCGATCNATYNYGTNVTLSEVPAAGFTFVGWSGGGCSGTGTCTVAMTAATTVTATFAVTTYVLTTNLAGNGAGSITSNPAGISCGANCSATYNTGTQVTLTAAPQTGSTFTGWSGGGCSGTGTCVVTMSADTSVTATFTLKQYQLTVTKSGAGTGIVVSSPAGIGCGATCSHLYDYGTVVTLTATPNAGMSFATWTGGGCGTSSVCTTTITAAVTIDAQFTVNPPNYAFVTSTTYAPGSLGGLGGADTICATRAAAAGLTGTYKAWLSTSTMNAKDHIGSATGWLRTDGKPFVNTIADIVANHVFYPLKLDEFHNPVGDNYIPTATNADGTYFSSFGTCSDWTSVTGGSPIAGVPSDDSSYFTHYSSLGCNVASHIYCFGVDNQAVVAPPPVTARRAFVSSNWVPGGGLAGADAQCQQDAMVAGLTGTYKALLATSTASAISRFDTTTAAPWARPDNTLLAPTASALSMASLAYLDAAPTSNAANNTWFNYPPTIYTGAADLVSIGTLTSTCSDWTNSALPNLAEGGEADGTKMSTWRASFGISCNPTNPPAAIICLQQ